MIDLNVGDIWIDKLSYITKLVYINKIIQGKYEWLICCTIIYPLTRKIQHKEINQNYFIDDTIRDLYLYQETK